MAEGWKPELIQGGIEGVKTDAERAEELCTQIARRYSLLHGSDIESDANTNPDRSVSIQQSEDVITRGRQYMNDITELERDEVLRLYRQLRGIQLSD